MSIESFNQNIYNQPNLQDSPEYQEQLQEKVLKVEQEQKYASKLAKANDVLKVLDLPDEIDDTLRETLMTFDNQTLKELVKKTSEEIFMFIDSIDNQHEEQKQDIIIDKTLFERQIQNTVIEKKTLEQQKQLQKIQKIKSILTPEILQKYSELKEKLDRTFF